jgi:hypothetical protein
LSLPLRLITQESYAVWFFRDEYVDVSFVNGFEYIKEDKNREFVISYGVGDRYAKVMRIGIEECLSTAYF